MIPRLIFLILTFISLYATSDGYDSFQMTIIDRTKSICDPSVKQIHGYYSIPNSDKKYFFWFFESRYNPSKDPLILWVCYYDLNLIFLFSLMVVQDVALNLVSSVSLSFLILRHEHFGCISPKFSKLLFLICTCSPIWIKHSHI